ncbi:transcriptional enhancer factor TEF-5 isoform X6 [Manis pentadactyla]|uniref:transcriptional enhancer factor TEF-5 isoform X6 n=1 Tax=Manis pentadactyla TaxID=143292 RepID=UPI00255CCBC0|nr:transcriptional enhancer factor TEF-5 isoform X6 [Manis pentadactyla]
MGPMRQALVLSLVWSRPHAPPLPRTRSPRTKPSRAWHPCPLPRLSPPVSYRTSSTHPPLCPKLSSPLPHGSGVAPLSWDSSLDPLRTSSPLHSQPTPSSHPCRRHSALLPLCLCGRTAPSPPPGCGFLSILPSWRCSETLTRKHLFVHIGQTNPAFSDPPLEAVDVRQIYDKFPEKKGGLKELYEKGPPNAFFLVKFWADLNSTIQEGPGAFYGVSSQYSSADSMTISVSTKVCSFGKQVVEKVETEYARLENGRFVYRIHRSPMCEYMINFIHKLKHLPEKYMMNSVLENFTILQVVTSRDSQETLLVIAFVFEVSTSEHGAQHHVYKLVKD